MEKCLFTSFPYRFTLKPILFGGKAMEFHGLRQGNNYDLLVQRDEFRSLWTQFPEQRVIHPAGQRVLRFDPFEFYEDQFGYDYFLLFRHAIDQGDYLVLPVEMLLFLTLLRSVREPGETTKVTQDLALLIQRLGVPLFPL
jgi:hypothetical protein